MGNPSTPSGKGGAGGLGVLSAAGRHGRVGAVLLALGAVLASLMAAGWQRSPSLARMQHFQPPDTCARALNTGQWRLHPPSTYRPCSGPGSDPLYATCGQPEPNKLAHWRWDSPACGAGYISQREAAQLLQGRWLAVAGDSVTRFAFGAFLRLLSTDPYQQMVVGHQDFEYTLGCGTRASFHWAPYANNITSLVRNWTATGQSPRILVMGTALWHMLHVGLPRNYGHGLSWLADALRGLQAQQVQNATEMFWFSVSSVVPAKLKTEQKRQQMTAARVAQYNQEIVRSGMLSSVPGMSLVDIHALSASCGPACTEDGIHFSNHTYDTAVQVFGETPVTVKCRIGVDDRDAYPDLARFVKTVSEDGGVEHFIIHARKAHLQGLNPHQNRTIPPLRPHWVFALMRDFPHLTFSVNGGIQSAPEVKAILESKVDGHGVEGVMVGRAAYYYPWQVLAAADTVVFGAESNPCKSRRQLLKEYTKYCDSVQGKWPMNDSSKENPNVRTLTIPLLNLFHGEPGTRKWKQVLDKVLRDSKSVGEVLERSLHCISDEVLDAPPAIPENMTAEEFLAKLEELPLPPLNDDTDDSVGQRAASPAYESKQTATSAA